LHSAGVLSVGMHCTGVYCVGVHGMNVPCMGMSGKGVHGMVIHKEEFASLVLSYYLQCKFKIKKHNFFPILLWINEWFLCN
jgi:hypothetical protein